MVTTALSPTLSLDLDLIPLPFPAFLLLIIIALPSCLPSMKDAKAFCTKQEHCPSDRVCDTKRHLCVKALSDAGETDGDQQVVLPEPQEPGAEEASPDIEEQTADKHEEEALSCPGGIGCKCAETSDCKGGWCVETPDGHSCSPLCPYSACPEGLACRQVPGTPGLTFACVHPAPRACRPCKTVQDCVPEVVVADMACVSLKGFHHCLIACASQSDCPPDHQCAAAPGGMASKVCIPASGACECTEGAVEAKAIGLCEVKAESGTCTGEFSCGSGCSAASPGPEKCNGLDDDCDGKTDDDLPSEPCDIVNQYGTCKGKTSCGPGGTPICSGSQAIPEVCNGVDDDCDGQTDEQEVSCKPNVQACIAGSCKSLCVTKNCPLGYQMWDGCHCKAIPTAVKQCSNGSAFTDCASIKPGMDWYGQDGHYSTDSLMYSEVTATTVQDLLTGLVWARDAVSGKTQNEATDQCQYNKAGLAGTGWRVPSMPELHGLVDYARANCPKWAKIFGETCPPGGWFWTVSPGPGASVLQVHFGDGTVGLASSGFANVRCVRGGGTPDAITDRFLDLIDGRVLDRVTGLIWEKKPSSESNQWKEALALCAAKGTGWRLPDAKEAMSLLDGTKTTCPKWDAVFGQSCPWQAMFWTSTPAPWDGGRAFRTDIGTGELGHDDVNAGWGVRCVW